MTFRLEVTPEGILQLIAKKVFQRGYLDLRLEYDEESDEWCVVKSGWQPLNTFTDPSPATLLCAVALVLEGKVVTPEINAEDCTPMFHTSFGRNLLKY